MELIAEIEREKRDLMVKLLFEFLNSIDSCLKNRVPYKLFAFFYYFGFTINNFRLADLQFPIYLQKYYNNNEKNKWIFIAI